MSNLLDSIRAVGKAADELALACASHNAVVVSKGTAGVSQALRHAYRTSMVTPYDMVEKMRKLR